MISITFAADLTRQVAGHSTETNAVIKTVCSCHSSPLERPEHRSRAAPAAGSRTKRNSERNKCIYPRHITHLPESLGRTQAGDAWRVLRSRRARRTPGRSAASPLAGACAR